MKLVIFGLSISSSWGNGHATIWRGLSRAMAERGHQIVFFERDVPYYSAHRDLPNPPYARLQLYSEWNQIVSAALGQLADADAAIVTSYCPDALAAGELLAFSRRSLRVFYDLDAPVTLERLRNGQPVAYIGPGGLRGYDLVLSFTGGTTLSALKRELGAPQVGVLYGCVDPSVHREVRPVPAFRGDLSYLGTYAEDRQAILEQLLVKPARRLPEKRFVIAGALYPHSFPWSKNIYFVRHLAPDDHAAFYCSSRLTLNVTRGAMAQMGYCASGRLFEAAACGTAILSDWWPGLDEFFKPDKEIFIARSTEDAVNVIERSDQQISAVAEAGRARVLKEHTAERRAEEFEKLLIAAMSSISQPFAARTVPVAGRTSLMPHA
jgi:spore maturation protein CgeB